MLGLGRVHQEKGRIYKMPGQVMEQPVLLLIKVGPSGPLVKTAAIPTRLRQLGSNGMGPTTPSLKEMFGKLYLCWVKAALTMGVDRLLNFFNIKSSVTYLCIQLLNIIKNITR